MGFALPPDASSSCREGIDGADASPSALEIRLSMGEAMTGLFDVADLHEVAKSNPQPFDHNGELMTGGRIWGP